MGNPIDMTGRRYGRLIAVRYAPEFGCRFWLFRCDCGNGYHAARGGNVRSGSVVSCGCQRREHAVGLLRKTNTRHGETYSPIWNTWRNIKHRTDPTTTAKHSIKYYIEPGITMYPAWRDSYEAFRDYILAELGPKPSPAHSIDRINPCGNYEPGNLRWATALEQRHNWRPRHR